MIIILSHKPLLFFFRAARKEKDQLLSYLTYKPSFEVTILVIYFGEIYISMEVEVNG